MKKFFKGCVVTMLVLVILGVLMLWIGLSKSGTENFYKTAKELTNGVVTFDLPDGINKLGEFLEKNAIYDIDEADMFDKNHAIWNGNVEKTLLAEGGIKNWHLEIGGCSFELKDSGDSSYYMEYKGEGKSQAYAEGEALYVKLLNGSDWSMEDTTEHLTLYVPMNVAVEELNAEFGAGQMVLNNLQAKKLVLALGAGQVTAEMLKVEQLSASVGAGEIILKDAQLKDVEAEVGAGNCEIGGTITGNVDAECAMGNMVFELAGKETDFDYNIQCVSGSVMIGEKEYSGLAQEQNIANGAKKSMDVECTMGNVEIRFEQ